MSMLWWVLVQFPRLRGVRGVMGVMLRCGITPCYWDSHLLEDGLSALDGGCGGRFVRGGIWTWKRGDGCIDSGGLYNRELR